MSNTLPTRRGAPRRAVPAELPIATYVTPDIRAAVDKAAGLEGLSRSTFARRAILRAIGAPSALEAAR